MAVNNWNEWQNHVLAELDRLNATLEKFNEDNSEAHENIKIDMATLKTKAGIWGGIAGLISGGIILALIAKFVV